MEAHVVVECFKVNAGVDVSRRQQGRQGGGKADAVCILGQVERLDAESVAHEDGASAVALGDDEGEHAVKALDAILAPLVPGLEDHLRVAVGEEAVAGLLQFLAQFRVIVDAAVEDDGETELRVGHGLGRVLGQIDDLETAVPEGGGPPCDDTGTIRAAWGQRPGHCCDGGCVRRPAIKSDFSGYATHEMPFTSLFYARSRHAKRKGADCAAPGRYIV